MTTTPKPITKPSPEAPKCPFCGRRVSVRRVDVGMYHCDRCQKMFQA